MIWDTGTVLLSQSLILGQKNRPRVPLLNTMVLCKIQIIVARKLAYDYDFR